MCDLRHHCETALRKLVVPIALSGMVWAQGLQAAPPPDVFAAWHARLSDAADQTLAAAVADKPWMKTSETAGDSARGPAPAGDPLVRVRAAIQRVQQLRPTIEPILRQQGVPAELSAIVLVESGGQPAALSPKGARGVWQFMPNTARRYGLVVGPGNDERVDVLKSTRAAAQYLRDLHDRFGTWPLALAAYNAGEDVVRRAIARTGAGDLAELGRVLPAETRGYIPAVMAAAQRLGGPGLVPIVRKPESKSGAVVYASTGCGTERPQMSPP